MLKAIIDCLIPDLGMTASLQVLLLSVMLPTGTSTFSTQKPEARDLPQIWGQDDLHSEFQHSQEQLDRETLFQKRKKIYIWQLPIPSHPIPLCIHEGLQKIIEESQGRHSSRFRGRNHRGLLLTGLFSLTCSTCFLIKLRTSYRRRHHLESSGTFHMNT